MSLCCVECHDKWLLFYHGGCRRHLGGIMVEVAPAVVEVFGHVGEGPVAKGTLVEGLAGVAPPVGHIRESKRKKLRCVTSAGLGSLPPLSPPPSSPVHDECHLGGEAAAAVHAQVPGHARVRAHVGLKGSGLLERPATLVALKRALLVYTPVSRHAVDGGERALAELARLQLGTGCCGRRRLLTFSGSLHAKALCGLSCLISRPQLIQYTGLAALLVLGLEVHTLVLQEVLWRLEEQRALRALVRVQYHHLGRPLWLATARQHQLGGRGSAQRRE